MIAPLRCQAILPSAADLGNRDRLRTCRNARRAARSFRRSGSVGRAPAIERDQGDDAMTQWIRFERNGRVGFGTLQDGTIAVHSGDMFAEAKPTGETVQLADARVLTPSVPSKMI